jgi:hypothetical protein
MTYFGIIVTSKKRNENGYKRRWKRNFNVDIGDFSPLEG